MIKTYAEQHIETNGEGMSEVVFGNGDTWEEMLRIAEERWQDAMPLRTYDRIIACADCGEPLTFAHGVGACLEGCGELHGYDQESDLWTPAILEDRRKA